MYNGLNNQLRIGALNCHNAMKTRECVHVYTMSQKTVPLHILRYNFNKCWPTIK